MKARAAQILAHNNHDTAQPLGMIAHHDAAGLGLQDHLNQSILAEGTQGSLEWLLRLCRTGGCTAAFLAGGIVRIPFRKQHHLKAHSHRALQAGFDVRHPARIRTYARSQCRNVLEDDESLGALLENFGETLLNAGLPSDAVAHEIMTSMLRMKASSTEINRETPRKWELWDLENQIYSRAVLCVAVASVIAAYTTSQACPGDGVCEVMVEVLMDMQLAHETKVWLFNVATAPERNARIN